MLAATLPSLISKFAPAQRKGMAAGVYSSAQFFGAFVGGTVGGVLAQYAGADAVSGFGLARTLLWLLASVTMAPPPSYHSTHSIGET